MQHLHHAWLGDTERCAGLSQRQPTLEEQAEDEPEDHFFYGNICLPRHAVRDLQDHGWKIAAAFCSFKM
jgi:hypothetical protein